MKLRTRLFVGIAAVGMGGIFFFGASWSIGIPRGATLYEVSFENFSVENSSLIGERDGFIQKYGVGIGQVTIDTYSDTDEYLHGGGSVFDDTEKTSLSQAIDQFLSNQVSFEEEVLESMPEGEEKKTLYTDPKNRKYIAGITLLVPREATGAFTTLVKKSYGKTYNVALMIVRRAVVELVRRVR